MTQVQSVSLLTDFERSYTTTMLKFVCLVLLLCSVKFKEGDVSYSLFVQFILQKSITCTGYIDRTIITSILFLRVFRIKMM